MMGSSYNRPATLSSGTQSMPPDDTILEDPRWEALATGSATTEEMTTLRLWSMQSLVAKAAWDALQPMTPEQIERAANRALLEIQTRKRNRLQTDGDELLGDRYRLMNEFGQSSIGSVWDAMDIATGKRVVVKIAAFRDNRVNESFEREVNSLQRLSHGHIVRLLDHGKSAQNFRYLVLQRLDGITLRDYLKHFKRLETQQVVRIALETASALEAVHAAGFVHNSLGPATIFLHRIGSNDCLVKLIGFENCTNHTSWPTRDEQSAAIFASDGIRYRSPEVLSGVNKIDPRSDIWSLGVILYEMLEGQPVYNGSNASEIIVDILRDPVPPLAPVRSDIPDLLKTLIHQCTQKEPEARIQTAAEVFDVLTRIGRHLGVEHLSATASRIEGPWQLTVAPVEYRAPFGEGTPPTHPYRVAAENQVADLPAVVPSSFDSPTLELSPVASPVDNSALLRRKRLHLAQRASAIFMAMAALICITAESPQLRLYALAAEVAFLAVIVVIGLLFTRVRRVRSIAPDEHVSKQ